MDSQLCIQALIVALIMIKLTLLASLFLYSRYQKTYSGFSFWIGSFVCSAGIQLLYFMRGMIPDFWSLGISNILLTVSMLLLFEGMRRFSDSRSVISLDLCIAAVFSVFVIYYTVMEKSFLIRTSLTTGMFAAYTFLIAREVMRRLTGNQNKAGMVLTGFLLMDLGLRILRVTAYVGNVQQERPFESTVIFLAGFIVNMVVAIGSTICLMMINGSRVTEELLNEKEIATQAQAELFESQQQLRRAIRFSPFPLMVHSEDGEVLQISEAWTEITGYELADIPTISDWVAKAYGDRITEVMKGVQNLYAIETRVDEGEFMITTRKGEQRIWHFSTAPLGWFDGKRLVISMSADVTERKKAMEQLRLLNQKLEAKVAERTTELEDLYNNAPCGYHSLDADGVYVRINDTELD